MKRALIVALALALVLSLLASATAKENDSRQQANNPAPAPAPVPIFTRPIPRVTLSDLLGPSRHLLDGNSPFILTDAVSQWNSSYWSFQYLLHVFGDSHVNFHPPSIPFNGQRSQPIVGTMRDAISAALYSANFSYVLWNPTWSEWSLLKAAMRAIDERPLSDFFFGDDLWLRDCLMREEIRSEFIMKTAWKLNPIGGPGVGVQVHQDHLNAGVWQAMISGSKSWILCPADHSVLMYQGRVDLFNPDYDKFPHLQYASCFKSTVFSGEILYDPPRWWHQTVNLGPINVAVSGSVVQQQHYELFIRQIEQECKASGTPEARWHFSAKLCQHFYNYCFNWLETKFGDGPKPH